MRVTQDLHTAVASIRQGGLLAYPTEAVFGLGCNPGSSSALQRLLALKQRPASKGLILLAANLGQLTDYLLPLTESMQARVEASWPGPVTWLLPVRPEVSPLIRGEHATLAVRISAHPVCMALCQLLGHPLVSTSANLGGQEPARTVQEVQNHLGRQIDLALDLPLGSQQKPTEIRDARNGDIIRPA